MSHVEMGKEYTFKIAEEKDVVLATSITWNLAKNLSFSPAMQTMISTTVSELGHNIVKYANKGSIMVTQVKHGKQVGIEVIAEDNGAGIEDLVKALSDHYSTQGTLGLGLPGVKRMMDEFFIDTDRDFGTKIVTRKWRPL